MGLTITERDVELLHQRNRVMSIRLELLNVRRQVVETLDGECIDAPVSLQYNSDVRRTCALSLYVKDATYIVSEDTRIWFDKRIRVLYGLYDGRSKELVYYPMGEFVITENGYTFDAENQKLDVTLVDPMSLLTKERGSAIGASKTVIEAGTQIRGAMIATITDLAGVTTYRIDEFSEESGLVPYDLEFEAGIYPYDIVTKLRDLFPGYETFFAIDGVFVCQKIPSCMDDGVAISADIMDQLITSQGIKPKVNFADVRNTTEIWGQSLESDRWSETCVTNGITYAITVPNVEVMDSGITYGFVADSESQPGQLIKINDLSAYPIYVTRWLADGTTSEDPIELGEMKSGVAYVLLFSDGRFYLQGELEIHAIVMEMNKQPSEEVAQHYIDLWDCKNIKFVINPESPYAADRGEMGVIKQVFSGGDFDNIYTTELAYDRAAYENWKTTRLTETVIIESILIPWLDINQKIELTSPISSQREQYLVKSISFDLGQSTMTTEAIRFYNYYPWLN